MAGLGGFCPLPFLLETEIPFTRGEPSGRFCGALTPGNACCLPCPVEEWVYGNDFESKLRVANWMNVPALVAQCLLLLTFAVLPGEVSHAHHLSVGLCLSLILVELAFVIPLGTKPNMCYDAITPNDMYTSMSCAWSGAMLITGAMGIAVWIMLRSLWTHLRICWDVKQASTFFWLTQTLGYGLPGLFLALCLPITGVSYRVGRTCFPNQKDAFATWFGWLIAFACLGALLQFTTTIFCLWLYLKDVVRGRGGTASFTGTSSRASEIGKTPVRSNPPTLSGQDRRLAWRRVRNVLSLQWRSIVLTTLVIIESVYFGVVFIHETKAGQRIDPSESSALVGWATCLVLNRGRKDKCPSLSKPLGVHEESVVASFYMAALIGLVTFALMVRRSMVTGWWHLIRHPRRSARRSVGEEDFIIVSPKRKSFGRVLESEKGASPQIAVPALMREKGNQPLSPVTPTSPIAPGILPDVTSSTLDHTLDMPVAGEVDRRHETTNLFDGSDEEGGLAEMRERRRLSKLDDVV